MSVGSMLRNARERVLGSTLARNSLWMLAGQAARTIIQAVYFVVVARSLHNDGYGAFAGTTALVMVLAPFSGLGAGFLLIKNVARESETLSRQLGNGLAVTAVTGLGFLVVIEAAAAIVLPSMRWQLVFSLGIAELLLSKIVDLCAFAFIAVQQLKWTALIQVLLSTFRLVAIAILATWRSSPSIDEWGVAYALATGAAAVSALAIVVARLGRPTLRGPAPLELNEGFFFSVSVSAQTFYNDIDKTMLTRMSGTVSSGIYAAAYRIIDVSFSPVSSVLAAAYSRFFRSGEQGLANVWRFSRRLLPGVAAYTGACGLVLWSGAFLLPVLLGEEYRDSASAMRWLAVIPLLRSAHYLLADAMSGAGHQRARSAVQLAVAVFNILLNLALIPAFSWRGAAWASIASDSMLVVGLYIVTRYVIRTDATSSAM